MNETPKTRKNKAIRQTAANSTMIADPDAKATRAQLQVIGRAVKDERIGRFDEEAWKAMTKGQASQIIAELRPDNDEAPASDAQKKKLSELIHHGFLKGLKRETYKNLTNAQAKRMIYKGLQNKAANITVEGFIPRKPLAPDALKTERQTERLTQLVNDGFLNPFSRSYFRSMTNKDASKYIGIGKTRQAQGVKAPEYIREPEAA